MEFNMTDFIKPELMVLVVVLYLVGLALKKWEYIPDKLIPLVLGISGIVLATVYVFATTTVFGAQGTLMALFVAVTQGILCAGASVFVNHVYKQLQKEE